MEPKGGLRPQKVVLQRYKFPLPTITINIINLIAMERGGIVCQTKKEQKKAALPKKFN